MPFITPPAPYAMIALKVVVVNVPCYTRFFFRGVTNAMGQSECQDIADWFNTTLITPFQTFMSTETIIEPCNCELRTATNLYFALCNTLQAGAMAYDPLPAATTLNATYAIDNSGGGTRIARGRNFFSGFHEEQMESGNWDIILRDAVQADLQTLVNGTTIGGENVRLAVWRPTYNVWADINEVYVSPVPKTIRHRRPR